VKDACSELVYNFSVDIIKNLTSPMLGAVSPFVAPSLDSDLEINYMLKAIRTRGDWPSWYVQLSLTCVW
jgi:hypothetical protein